VVGLYGVLDFVVTRRTREIGSALALVGSSLLAGFIPARPAARIDPVRALRHD